MVPVAYTYTRAKMLATLVHRLASVWNSNATVGTTNDQELHPSSGVARRGCRVLYHTELEVC